jgi:hypothetical protein
MPHPQHFQPSATLESLDNEVLVQLDAETSERVLHRLDPTSSPAATGSETDTDDDCDVPDFNDGIDRTSSADWKKSREGSMARKPWWRRPSPTW